MARPSPDFHLSQRQLTFADGILAGLTQGQAYIRAGYFPSTLAIGDSAASHLASSHKIQAYLGYKRAKRAFELDVSAERVLQEYARIAFADIAEVLEWGPEGIKLKSQRELSADARRAIAEVSHTVTESGGAVRVKLHNKLAALDSLAKYLGMFGDESGRAGVTINAETVNYLNATYTPDQLRAMLEAMDKQPELTEGALA